MSASSEPPPRSGEADPDLVGLVDELVARLQAGEPIDLEAVAREDPARAEQIRRLLPTLEMLADLGESAVEDVNRLEPPALHRALEARVLGDYQIIREVGRGGMGVVYEARQVSLGGRRVALKVLPFAAAVDPKHLRRFRIEARAAAMLHHPHIVPVHGVGCERGVHYYAMQFIEGRNLAELIRELRRLAGPEAAGLATSTEVQADFALAGRLASGDFGPPRPGPEGAPTTSITSVPDATRPGSESVPESPAPADVPPTGRAPDSSLGSSTRTSAFFRTVAQLGIQAAEALEYAHEQGVVHRDIKPSNLLIDDRGKLWITDFGLARLHDEGGLTMTGDLLGTLRYMSPEQASGDRLTIDHRTDVYSLGVTLYELLTLEPAIRGRDRRELIRRVLEEEPRPTRRLNPSVPPDLATIVGKAIAKEARDRYGSARALADDLRRFLEHRPIAARPPTLLDRAAKWARRHSTAVATAAVLLMLALAALSISTVLLLRERDRAEASEARARANATRAEIGEARAEDLVGLARLEAGDLEGARSCFERAHAILSRLDAAHPGVFDIRLGRARNRRFFGMWHRDRGDPQAAERSLRESIALLEVLAGEDPHRWATQDLGLSYETLGRILLEKRPVEAYECFARTVAAQRRFIDRNRDDVSVRAAAVTTQIYCPFPKLRDPRWAVEQAEKVRDHRPKFSGGWTLLGLAYYRRGEAGGGGADWEEAAVALERATELRRRGEVAALNYSGTDAHDDFGLAMAYARLRRRDRDPVAYYDRAVAWMDRYRPQDVGLRLLRAEAAGLLGVDDRPGPGPAGPAAGPR